MGQVYLYGNDRLGSRPSPAELLVLRIHNTLTGSIRMQHIDMGRFDANGIRAGTGYGWSNWSYNRPVK